MSKEPEVKLDELNCLYTLLDRANHDEYLSRIGIEEATKFLNENQKYAIILRQALQRLEAIDNSKPSEALEELEMLHDCSTAIQELPSSNWVEYAENVAELDLKLYLGYENIKQALIKSQEQEKVLSIIKEYQVDIWLLKQCDYENYIRIRKEAMVSIGQIVNEDGITLEDEITQEYFDLLKRLLDEQDN